MLWLWTCVLSNLYFTFMISYLTRTECMLVSGRKRSNRKKYKMQNLVIKTGELGLLASS